VSATLAEPASFAESIQKSRFLARAWPVESTESALAHIAQCKREEASHHAFGYRIGQSYRFDDASEPAGTAGRTILQAIDGQGLDQVVVVVSRWFGGIKLGAGGLMRAYGGAAAECLRRAQRRELILMQRLSIALPFAFESALRLIVHDYAGHISNEAYDESGFSCSIELPLAQVALCTQRLRDSSRGQALVSGASIG